MFSNERQYLFHLELTDKCNAACPMCERTLHNQNCKADRSKVRNMELDLEIIMQNFPPSFCAQIRKMDFCGGLGDPPAARECLEICEYFTDHGVKVVMSTNGGSRSTHWWKRLGTAFSRNPSLVEFHIDGLKDTNHLYRVNTRFDRIIDNARAYLGAGGNAEWHFILFKHNQHQVEEALAVSRKMGFRSFTLIDTVRFGRNEAFSYQMPNGEVRNLERPTRVIQATGSEPEPTEAVQPNAFFVNGIDLPP